MEDIERKKIEFVKQSLPEQFVNSTIINRFRPDALKTINETLDLCGSPTGLNATQLLKGPNRFFYLAFAAETLAMAAVGVVAMAAVIIWLNEAFGSSQKN